jgi:CheY-like chemotaxis protein
VTTTILIVDDDHLVRKAVARVLRHPGYRTVEAENGSAALAALESEPSIALVITDMQMPVMDGKELIERIRSRPRHLPVILMSGTHKQGGYGEDRVIGKPFGNDALRALAYELVHGETSPVPSP